ncbi:hypothetical protein HDU97_003968 [Phlyctochytrium planicorne]|nr:hypothetical protein HDU97_003968 [Phlyctochytrium planicorne]
MKAFQVPSLNQAAWGGSGDGLASVVAQAATAAASAVDARDRGRDEGRLAEAVRGLESSLKQESKIRRDLEAQLHQLALQTKDVDGKLRDIATRLEVLGRETAAQWTHTESRLIEIRDRDRASMLSQLSQAMQDQERRLQGSISQSVERLDMRFRSGMEEGIGRSLSVSKEALTRSSEAMRAVADIAASMSGKDQGLETATSVANGIAGRVVTALAANNKTELEASQKLKESVMGAVGNAALASQNEAARLVEDVGKVVMGKLDLLSSRIDGETRRLDEDATRAWKEFRKRVEDASERLQILEQRIGAQFEGTKLHHGAPAFHLLSKPVPTSSHHGHHHPGTIESRLYALEAWRDVRQKESAEELAKVMDAVGKVHATVKMMREEQALARQHLFTEVCKLRNDLEEETQRMKEMVDTAVKRCARAMVIL